MTSNLVGVVSVPMTEVSQFVTQVFRCSKVEGALPILRNELGKWYIRPHGPVPMTRDWALAKDPKRHRQRSFCRKFGVVVILRVLHEEEEGNEDELRLDG